MIKRILHSKISQLLKKFPVVAVLGPRQAGKTTLLKNLLIDFQYVSLEDIDVRDFATSDPRAFLENYGDKVIIDEVQRVPELLSYIQTHVDKKNKTGIFVLTGSNNFLLHEKISQTLAGRIGILNLVPLSLEEISSTKYEVKNIDDLIFKGFYPRIYDKDIDPNDFYPSYIQTYIERDLRLIKNISDLNLFQKFLKLCAGRSGQILNLTALANDCGINHNTVRSWISILEASFIIFLLNPYFENFNKQLIKSPKLYFYDTGLLCNLLNIANTEQLSTHYLRGSIFENFVIVDLVKYQLNRGRKANFYFLRDKAGHEIDLIIEEAGKKKLIEIKSGQTISSTYFDNIKYWTKVFGKKVISSYLIYAGNENQKRTAANVLNVSSMYGLFDKM